MCGFCPLLNATICHLKVDGVCYGEEGVEWGVNGTVKVSVWSVMFIFSTSKIRFEFD